MSDFKIVSLLNPVQIVNQTGAGVGVSAGLSSQSSGTVTFGSSAGNVTFGLSNGYMTASAPSGGGGGGTNYVFSNSNGVTFGTNVSTVTASVVTNYMASNQSSNFVNTSQSSLFQQTSATSAITSNAMNTSVSSGFAGTGFTSTSTVGTNIVATHGTNGLSVGIPNYITTAPAAQTVQTQASGNIAGIGFTSTTTAGTAVVATQGTNGLSMGVPAYLTTYAAQTNQTVASGNIAGVGTTFAGTNISGSLTLNSVGLNLALSVAAGGGAGDGYNSAQFTNSTANSTMPLVWAGNSNGSGNVTIGLTGSTITMSAPSGGGAGDGGNIIAAGGSTAASTGTVVFSNSNNVSFSLNGSTITASASFNQTVDTNKAGVGYTSTTQAGTTVGATHNTAGLSMAWPPFITTYAAQTVQTQAAGNLAGTGYTSTTQAGSTVGVTQNTAGLSMAWPPYITTFAQSVQTQASGNIVGSGFTSTTTAGSVPVATLNSNGLSMGVPQWITTFAAQSVQTQASGNLAGIGYTSTTQAGTTVGATHNTAGLSMAWPPYITTYAAQTNQTAASGNIAGTGYTSTTQAGTTVGVTHNTAGLSMAWPPFITNAAGGGGFAAGASTDALGTTGTVASQIVFFAGANITLSQSINGNSASLSVVGAAGGGGGAATIGGYELFPPLGGNTAFSTGGLGTIYFQKFIAPGNFSFNNFERRYSGSTVSSAISAQAAHTISYGLYSLGTGASTSIYNLIASSSMFMQASYSSNLSAGLTVSAGGVSYTNSSAGTVRQGDLTGFKHIYMPFTSTITAGGNYAFAQVVSSATTGATGPLRIGFLELSVINNLTIGKIFNSTVVASNASYVGDWAQGVYSSSSNGLPSTLAISGLTNAVSQQRMYLQLDA